MKKKFDWSYVPIVVTFALSMALAPGLRAQDLGTITRITTVPEGAQYLLDGQAFTHSQSAIWPTGSKHTLSVSAGPQSNGIRTQYTFRDWEFAGGSFNFNPVTVTATPSIGEYKAIFDTQYAIGVA